MCCCLIVPMERDQCLILKIIFLFSSIVIIVPMPAFILNFLRTGSSSPFTSGHLLSLSCSFILQSISKFLCKPNYASFQLNIVQWHGITYEVKLQKVGSFNPSLQCFFFPSTLAGSMHILYNFIDFELSDSPGIGHPFNTSLLLILCPYTGVSFHFVNYIGSKTYLSFYSF